jgi:hypothetical protein
MQTKLKQHLAIATGAVSAAAVPMGADAAIVYKDDSNAFSVSYAGPTSADWDIDGAGGNEFRFFTNVGNFINIISDSVSNGRGLVATTSTNGYFNNLRTGVDVGPILSGSYVWNTYTDNRTIMLSSSAGGSGGLQNGSIGSNFIGFRFLSGTDMLYGWAELILSTTGGGTVTVNRWAYNDTPDGSIEVGQTQDAPTPAPAPSTLALLAAGAFGVRRWRARRAAA